MNLPVNRHLPSTVFAIALLAATPVAAKEKVDPAAYPELSADALLPLILADLKQTMKDPWSIRGMLFCPARSITLKDGKPVSWSVMLQFNAKNGFGGYVGVRTYRAAFRKGQLNGPVRSAELDSEKGFAAIVNAAVAASVANCPAIPDEQIQQILSGAQPG
jgi:hypothetical protein